MVTTFRGSKCDSVKMDVERASHHTAGHVWSYCKTGIEVESVHLSSEIGCWGHVELRTPFIIDVHDRMSIVNAAWILLAGCVAEELILGSSLDKEGDREAARSLVNTSSLSRVFFPQNTNRKERRAITAQLSSLPDQSHQFLTAAENVVRGAFTREEKILHSIAGGLIDRGVLTAEELEDLIEEGIENE